MYPVTIPVGMALVYGSEYFSDPAEVVEQKSVIEQRNERLAITAVVQAQTDAENAAEVSGQKSIIEQRKERLNIATAVKTELDVNDEKQK